MKEDNTKQDVESMGQSNEKNSHCPVDQLTDELVLGEDGFKLFPQPVPSDELDPLNWSTTQKHTILAIVMSL